MNREMVRKLTWNAIFVAAMSVFIIAAGLFLSSGDKYEREQEDYSEQFSSVLEAASYEEVDTSNFDSLGNIKAAYRGYDDNGKTVGFVIDLTVDAEEETNLHLLTGIAYDGAQLTGIKRIHDEENPSAVTDEQVEIVASQTIGHQIPVAISNEEPGEIQVEQVQRRLYGLNDGTYFAQEHEADRIGYIDFVEIEVNDGIITKVQWDAFNTDRTNQNRREAALSGAYTVSGENWASQSYNLCHALLDCQDPALLAMKSDGTTTIVPGVTVNIRAFVDLLNECIDYSRVNYTKEDYYAGIDEIFMQLFSGTAEENGFISRDGFIVFSFDDYPNAFDLIEDPRDNITGMTGSYEVGGNVDSGIDSLEDGINLSGNANAIGSIDGIPLTEVRTYITGIEDDEVTTSYIITAMNSSYKFLKNYLNWMA